MIRTTGKVSSRTINRAKLLTRPTKQADGKILLRFDSGTKEPLFGIVTPSALQESVIMHFTPGKFYYVDGYDQNGEYRIRSMKPA